MGRPLAVRMLCILQIDYSRPSCLTRTWHNDERRSITSKDVSIEISCSISNERLRYRGIFNLDLLCGYVRRPKLDWITSRCNAGDSTNENTSI
ncbi:hypothetical protein BDV40DRAFT_241938 [Aspergillus tamarii]|uniref:Uncharacterized protein n=1 Tax=Aspergillus tamarii TaxID=41984 RepID=A0A5N6ULC4_ASPTM|nr:hypothetical protein BDV40DRAFT_241938 [Aspergillus tamarii]